jgi:hypothetical protein
LMDALRARAGGFLGAASLPRHLRRRATSHNPRHRRAMRPNAKRAKKIDEAGFAAASSRDATNDASPARSFWKPGSSSRYRFAIERGLAVHWCRRARRRPERARRANRERLLLESARATGEEDEDFSPARTKKNDDDDDDVSFPPASRAEDVASFRASSVFGEDATAATETHWRRLETHAWHAKRFALVRRWGWALPLGAPGRGRGWRETMRRAAESAIAHDASHHAAFVLRVEGEADGPSSFETARAALETLVGVGREPACGTNANAKALFRSAAFAAGAVAVDATLVDESGGTVSPATFVLATRKDVQNNTEETETTEETVFVFVWVPAAAREEAFRLCQKVTRSVLFSKRCSLRLAEGRLCRFEVAGALSSSLLETLSGNKAILNERDGGVTPRGVYSFETKLDAKSVADKRRNHKNEKETGAALPGLDRSYGGGGSARARNRVDAATEAGDGSFRLLAAVAADVFADRPSLLNDRPWSSNSFCPVTIIRRAKPPARLPNAADAGYTLLAPAPFAHELWLALVALGASAAGLREWRWLAVAAGARVFPEDFPESQAATRDVESVLAEASARARRTPRGKRASDEVVDFAARAAGAFVRREHLCGDEKKKNAYARAVVRCFRGGNPAVGAAVLAPTQAQRDAARRGARDRDRDIGAPSMETDIGVVDGASASSFDSRIDTFFAKKNGRHGSRAPDRRALAFGCERQTVLGYVTSASAPGAARGVASAVVDVRLIEEAFPGVFAKGNKKTFSKAREILPAALLAPSAAPAAIAPATLELVDDKRFDPVWW